MNTLVLYYSYTGSGKKLAEKLAGEIYADLEEIKTEKRPGTVSAYVLGSLASMRQKTAKIAAVQKDLNSYDSFVLVAPIWAGSPAPAFNSAIDLLPKGKDVELYLVSASGGSNKEKLTSFIQGKGLKLTAYHDIKQREI